MLSTIWSLLSNIRRAWRLLNVKRFPSQHKSSNKQNRGFIWYHYGFNLFVSEIYNIHIPLFLARRRESNKKGWTWERGWGRCTVHPKPVASYGFYSWRRPHDRGVQSIRTIISTWSKHNTRYNKLQAWPTRVLELRHRWETWWYFANGKSGTLGSERR